MKKYVAYITSLFLILLSSCSESEMPEPQGENVPEGTPIDIVAGAELPEMNFGASRAMGEEPTLDDLKINLLVFDGAGVMLQYIPPEDITIESTSGTTVFFKVHGIYSSNKARRLHFVVTSAEDLLSFEGGEYIEAMASETTVMSALMSTGETDAYWGLSEQESITENMKVSIKLIRNFVKINVVSNESPSKFKLLGYTVVNRPNKGTVAPYIHQSHDFAEFVTADGTLVDYDNITDIQGYRGVNPAGIENTMTYTTEAEVEASLAESEKILKNEGNLDPAPDSPYYIYERSQSGISAIGGDVRVTYVIVKGVYNGKTAYYKLDLGRTKSGDFEFYDLLRNFSYTLVLNSVEGPGAETLHDAMAGVANNNVAASVVTRDLFSISYDNEKIEVSTTRVIFTEKETNYLIQFRYTVPTGAGYTFNAADLMVYDMGKENGEHHDMTGLTGGKSKTIDLGGDVIKTAVLSQGTGGWYNLRIATNEIPTDARRLEQTLRVYYKGGTVNLGRTITVMLRKPWELTDVSSTWATETPTDVPAGNRNSLFEVNFTIPEGMVSTQFPLTLTFESDKQNMYAVYGSELQVETGKSGFKGATTDSVMRYEWRMEWADYKHTDGSEGGKYTAKFKTNTTLAEDRAYSTLGIDNSTGNGTREDNNGTNSNKFCVRIANKGLKVIEPYYVNITR